MIEVISPTIVTRPGNTPWPLAAFKLGLGLLGKFPKYSLTDILTSTRYMQYRASPLAAPLGVMVPVQGNVALTAGDVLSYGRGTQINGNNYDTESTNQGTEFAYYEPLYIGADGKLHQITETLSKSAADTLIFTPLSSTGSAPSVATATTLLGKLLIATRFDADNYVKGTAYEDLTVNGTNTAGTNVALTSSTPSSTMYLWSGVGGVNAGHLGYFRWKFDDVWSDANLALVYGGGTVVSPDRVMPNPECLKAMWAPGLRAASGSFTGARTAEGAFWNWRPYVAGASNNPDGTWVVNGRFEAALGAEWVASANAVLALNTTAAYLVGMSDTSVLSITNTGATNQTASQTITAAAGTTFYFSGWAAKVDSTSGDIAVYSGTAATGTLLLSTAVASTTPATASGVVTVATGDTFLTIVLTATGADGTIARFDNVGAWLSKVVNGEMEGTYAKTGAALHTSTAATTTYDATHVYDATAWTLTNAVAGMIVEGDGGKCGFITVVGADQLTVDAWVGGTPTNGQAANVYSALTPGWTLDTALGYRTTGATGTYAQGLIRATAAGNCSQTILTTSGQWYFVFAKAKRISGSGSYYIQAGSNIGTLAGSATWVTTSLAFRATGATTIIYATVTGASTVVEFDDFAVIPLSPITFTATPATDANSQESNGVNQNGGDTLTIPATGNLPAPVVLGTTASLAGYFDTLDTSAFVDGPLGTALQAYPDGSVLEFFDGTYYAIARKGAAGTAEALSGTELLTGFTNNGTYPFATFTTAGLNISDVQNTAAQFGAGASNSFAQTSGALYKLTLTGAITSGSLRVKVASNVLLTGSPVYLNAALAVGANANYWTATAGTASDGGVRKGRQEALVRGGWRGRGVLGSGAA